MRAFGSAGARFADVAGTSRLTRTGPLLRHAPVAAVAGPLVLDLAATSRRLHHRRAIYLTASGPAGTFTDRLKRPHGSDLASLLAAGPDDHLYIAWTRHAHGSARRVAVLRRVL